MEPIELCGLGKGGLPKTSMSRCQRAQFVLNAHGQNVHVCGDLVHEHSVTGSPSSIYEQLFILYMFTFAMLRDSSDLHIYKDLHGENNGLFL